MRILPTPLYTNEPELLDTVEEVTERDLQGTLRDIRRANIFGLGTWVVRDQLAQLLADVPKAEPVRVLDLATGSGDIPEELCRWARREGRKMSFVLTDISPSILKIARRRITRAGIAHQVEFAVCDAGHPPFADRSFDVVLCSLALHHFGPRKAQEALRHMHRMARLGFIVNDIYRAGGAWCAAWALSRLTTANRLTRHDGPASVLRSYTPSELCRLSERAGICASVHTYPFWRAAVVGRVNGTGKG